MLDEEVRGQLLLLLDGIRVLSLQPSEQVKWMRHHEVVVGVDELVLYFEDASLTADRLMDEWQLPVEFQDHLIALREALAHLEAASGDGIFNIQALSHDPQWEQVRMHAHRAFDVATRHTGLTAEQVREHQGRD